MMDVNWVMVSTWDLLHVTLTVAAILLVVDFFNTKMLKRKMPPGPSQYPVIGNMHLLGRLPHHSFMKMASKYGPIMSMRLGTKPSVIVTSAEVAKEVLKTQDHVFSNRPTGFASQIIAYGKRDIVWSDVNPHWRLLRKLSQNELLSNSRIATFQELRRGEMFLTMKSIIADSKEHGVIDLNSHMRDYSLNNITLMMFGKKYFGVVANSTPEDLAKRNEIQSTITLLLEAAGSYPLGQYIPYLRWLDIGEFEAKMWKAAKNMDGLLSQILAEHRAKKHTSEAANNVQDVMDVALSLSGPDKLSDVGIKAFFMDMLSAGTDTTSGVIMWTMAELMRNPDVRKRAQEELRDVVGMDRMVEESDLENLPYLQAVVKETMRLHPVVPLLYHSAIEDGRLGGYFVPKGARVTLNAYAINRDPAHWERPLEFNPERFTNPKSEAQIGQNFSLISFGYGKRACPGKNLGHLSANYTIAHLLHSCDWALPPGQKPEDVDFSEYLGLTMPPKNPVKLVATPRLALLQTV